MATRHTYATADDLRDYLAGTSYSSGWTSDAGSIRRILEAASRRIDDYCGGGTFGPLTETRYYDIGTGALRDSPQYQTVAITDDIKTSMSTPGVVPLDGWIVSPTTVTAYGATDRATSETLTEGHANDFLQLVTENKLETERGHDQGIRRRATDPVDPRLLGIHRGHGQRDHLRRHILHDGDLRVGNVCDGPRPCPDDSHRLRAAIYHGDFG